MRILVKIKRNCNNRDLDSAKQIRIIKWLHYEQNMSNLAIFNATPFGKHSVFFHLNVSFIFHSAGCWSGCCYFNKVHWAHEQM